MDAGWYWGLCDYPPDRKIPGPEESMRRRLQIKPRRPTINAIRKTATAESLKAGRECLGRGGVVPIGTDRGIFAALVRDGETRKVIASMGYGSGLSYCACPYDGRGACGHVVAALLYASENFERLIREENDGKSGAWDVLSGAPATQPRNFLAGEAGRDEGPGMGFPAGLGGTRTRPNVRADLDEVYHRMDEAGLYGGTVDFDGHMDAARSSADRGDYGEAIRIYREIAEAIQDNMENVDDSYAHYDTILSMALNQMADCIKRQGPDHRRKRPHISYLYGRAALDDYGCGDLYLETASKLCSDEEDRAYCRELGG